jgi:hypothetical protein
MVEMYLIPGDSKAFEYFCTQCFQLRLSLIDRVTCGHCGSDQITTGLPGQLDKQALVRKYRKGETMGKIIRVDFTGVESGGGINPRVPESDYGLKCTGADLKKGTESEKPYIDFAFKLTKGPKRGVGKTLHHSCSLQKQSLWNLRNLLESMGMTVPSKAVKIPVDKLKGKECAGTVVDDEYEGRKKSIIGSFFPLEDLGKTSDDADELEEGGEEESEEEIEGEEEEEAKPAKTKTKKKKKPAAEEEEEGGEEEGEEEELFS